MACNAIYSCKRTCYVFVKVSHTHTHRCSDQYTFCRREKTNQESPIILLSSGFLKHHHHHSSICITTTNNKWLLIGYIVSIYASITDARIHAQPTFASDPNNNKKRRQKKKKPKGNWNTKILLTLLHLFVIPSILSHFIVGNIFILNFCFPPCYPCVLRKIFCISYSSAKSKQLLTVPGPGRSTMCHFVLCRRNHSLVVEAAACFSISLYWCLQSSLPRGNSRQHMKWAEYRLYSCSERGNGRMMLHTNIYRVFSTTIVCQFCCC